MIKPVLPLLLAAAASAEVRFNRDIRPIMADTCFRCHGPDRNARMAGLRLDIREEALKPNRAGIAPVVPGDPAKSAVVQRIFASDPARTMPPASAHKELSAKQKDLIRQWVAEGARYEGHWAYEPLRRPDPPGAGHPVDSFVEDRLRREGLMPATEADPRTLARRVSLDLTGIPPTPAEIDAYIKDKSPGAYERLVDRLLSSQRYAERQAMQWLDAVRYADTCGFHGDNPFPAWPFRDYVLRAFRDNKPFDVFTREQLAGDLLPGGGVEQKIASAFNRMNRTSAEGGLQPKEYLAKYASDRVRTTAAVWLGATLGCAECHDHKFDPFTARDFYSMKAFFADVKETGLVPDRGPAAWGSLLELPSEEQKAAREGAKREVEEARRALDGLASKLVGQKPGWEADILAAQEAGTLRWHYQRPLSATSSSGAILEVFNDRPIDSTYQDGASLVSQRKEGAGIVIATGPAPDHDTYTTVFRPGVGSWKALGLEAVQDESLAGVRLARGSDRLVITAVEVEAAGKRATPVLALSNLGFAAAEHPAMAAIDGDPKTGFGLTTYGNSGNIALAIYFSQPLNTAAGTDVTVRIRHDSAFRRATLGRFRLALSADVRTAPQPGDPNAREGKGGLPDPLVNALRASSESRTKEQRELIDGWFETAHPELRAARIELERREARRGLIDASIPRVVVSEATEPAETRILARGNFLDDSGPVVEPAVPAFLGKVETGGNRATRLDLAGWLVSQQNPLTARVQVNRMWRQFFGTGLSRVLDDLGSQGELPTQPELIDWLAAEFMQPSWRAEGAHPWDMRHLIRAIVTSKTYRRSSVPAPGVEERDPGNRLLARQNRYRVDAELVRDIALSVSGLLHESFGGPSFRPYQPDGFLGALNFPKRDYSASMGADQYRRGVYAFWQRTFLHPAMSAFDAPSREECTVNRATSNTPLQALVLLNDPTFVEAARALARNMAKNGGRSPEDRIDWAFLRATGRKAVPEERDALAGLYRKSLQRFRSDPAAARRYLAAGPATPELAATAAVARAILNVHETITRN